MDRSPVPQGWMHGCSRHKGRCPCCQGSGASALTVPSACDGHTARLDAELSRAGLQDWQGHKAKVVAIAPIGSRVYSLGSDGSIRGWLADRPTLQSSMMRCACCKDIGRWSA